MGHQEELLHSSAAHGLLSDIHRLPSPGRVSRDGLRYLRGPMVLPDRGHVGQQPLGGPQNDPHTQHTGGAVPSQW